MIGTLLDLPEEAFAVFFEDLEEVFDDDFEDLFGVFFVVVFLPCDLTDVCPSKRIKNLSAYIRLYIIRE
jgi:alkyl hydroperoxide reductase subunit AhpC